jgi:folate-binding protein YgfZ
MSTPWRHILHDTPANWQDRSLIDFTDPDGEIRQALAGDIVAPLPGIAVIEASGADVTAFLHGQVSSDIQALADGSSQLAAYCNPKGRMLALFRIIRRDDGYFLLLPAELLDATLKRLRMFVMRSKVLFSDVSESWAVLGCSGDKSMTALAGQGLNPPPEADSGAWQDDAGIWRLRGEQPRALVLATKERMGQLWAALTDSRPVGEPAWRLLDIRAGIPQVLSGTVENIIPQMANLDLIGGISFTKGCYPGQEIIARMHYLGNLKRRMYRLTISTPDLPAPGSDVHTADDARAGEIVMAAPSLDGKSEALAILQIERAQTAQLQVAGHAADVRPAPYLAEEQGAEETQ